MKSTTTTTTTSVYLRRASVKDLHTLALARGYTQTRGAGTGVLPSASAFIDALGAGELVAIGPVMAWTDAISALNKALELNTLTDREREALGQIREQILSDANFDDDDV